MALGGLVASAFVAVGFMLVGPSRESTGPDAAAPPTAKDILPLRAVT